MVPAQLQVRRRAAARTGRDNPVLIESRPGADTEREVDLHARIEEISDQYAFLIRSLEMTPRLAQPEESEAP